MRENSYLDSIKSLKRDASEEDIKKNTIMVKKFIDYLDKFWSKS